MVLGIGGNNHAGEVVLLSVSRRGRGVQDGCAKKQITMFHMTDFLYRAILDVYVDWKN